MLVHSIELGRTEEELVHARLSLAIVDHMARIKVCGHAGTASELNFCIYCKLKQSYLVDNKAYKPKGEFPLISMHMLC
jgi:hypothetical protein